MQPKTLVPVLVTCLWLVACGDRTPRYAQSTSTCETGSSQPCTCDTGEAGVQICADDGAQWNPCACVPPLPGDGESERDGQDDGARDDDGETENGGDEESNPPTGPTPCIDVDPAELVFQDARLDAVSSQQIVIRNCSPDTPLQLQGIRLTTDSDREFGVVADTTQPAALAVGETHTFDVTYAATQVDDHHGTLEVVSDDSARSPLNIPVVGNSADRPCLVPIAVASVRDAEPTNNLATIPLATVRFDGSESHVPHGGPVARYEWTIVDAPADSTSRLTPAGDRAAPELFLDLAGRYEIELRVFDDQNAPSCGAATVVVLASPNEDIHIQLVWRTPGDPDESSAGLGGGSDLDLHFLHAAKEGARWDATAFDNPWDCNWQNTSPIRGLWDPSLDIDDTNYGATATTSVRAGVYY